MISYLWHIYLKVYTLISSYEIFYKCSTIYLSVVFSSNNNEYNNNFYLYGNYKLNSLFVLSLDQEKASRECDKLDTIYF